MNFEDRTELIKNWVEIVAIVLAGIWAFYTFVIKDAPSLHRAMDSNTSVTIDSISPNRLYVDVVSDFKNKLLFLPVS